MILMDMKVQDTRYNREDMIDINTIDLKNATLNWFGRKQYRSKSKGTLWPSEASVEFTNQWDEQEISGKCHRAVYYRLQGISPSNPPTAKSLITFLYGHQIEATVTEAWKQMGIWDNNSVKWEDPSRNLSGEFDVILREGDQLYIAEVKSFYGYYANKEIMGYSSGRGAKKIWTPGKPKDNNLLQAAIYADQTFGQLAGVKLFYMSRDNNDMAEFNITTNEEKEIFINGVRENRFTVKDIYDRYSILEYIRVHNIKPNREFELYPSDERVAELDSRGLISATAFKDHCSGKQKYTSWQCSYCDYKDHCWKEDEDEGTEITLDNLIEEEQNWSF